MQHCSSASYKSINYSPYNILPSSCIDSSDLIHEVGSNCNIEQHVQDYCQSFCPTNKGDLYSFIDDEGRKVLTGEKCDIICQSKEDWVLNQTDPKIIDPRNCQASCSNKTYNCAACTDPEYDFTCNIGGVKHCLHPDLICDGHQTCDDGSDETLTSDCINKLVKDKMLKPEATVVCPSPMYDNIMTVAVACDQIVECRNGEDEHWLCTNSKYSVVGAVIAFVMLFFFSIFMKYFRWTITELSLTVNFKPKKCKDALKIQITYETEGGEETEEDGPSFNLQDVLDTDVFNRDHDIKEFRDEINLFIQEAKIIDEKQVRIEKNQKLYQLELRKHKGKVSDTALCIKNTIDPGNAKILFDDAMPGITRRYFPIIEDLQEWIEKRKTIYFLMNKAKNIASIYIDICKDTYLMFVIYILVGGFDALINFPTNLSSVVVFCQFGSIVFPLLISGILHANDEMKRMKVSFLGKTWKYFLANLKSPITPLLITQEYDENKAARRRTMMHYNGHRNYVLELMAEGTRVRHLYAKFLRIDLGLELIFQLFGQITLLLLTVTETPTTGGLELLFRKADNFYLGLSIVLGFRTIYMAYLKTVAVEKPYFGITSKIVLMVWTIVSAGLRLIVMVLYFTPSFGFFSILHHWKKEQIPFADQYRDQINKTGTLYLYKVNITKDQWDKLERYSIKEKKGPDYHAYTVFSLDWYFTFFWIILMIHISINIIMKLVISTHFRFIL